MGMSYRFISPLIDWSNAKAGGVEMAVYLYDPSSDRTKKIGNNRARTRHHASSWPWLDGIGRDEEVQELNPAQRVSDTAVLTAGGEGSIRNGAAFFIDWRLKWSVRRLSCENNITRNL